MAPEALLDTVGLLLLIPIARLLPSTLHPGFQPILRAVAVFYVVDRLRDVFENLPEVGRVVFLVECAAAALVCVWLLRPARLATLERGDRLPGWLGPAVKLAFVVFVLSFLANMFGNVSLAMLLGGGLLTSLYIGIGVYAGLRVLGITLDVTTQTAWAQRSHFVRGRRDEFVAWAGRAGAVLGWGMWIYWSLWAFAIRDPAVQFLTRTLTAPLTRGTASVSLGDLFAFALTVAAAVALSRIVRFVLMEDVFPRVRTGRGVPHAVSATAYYVILFGGFMLAVAAGQGSGCGSAVVALSLTLVGVTETISSASGALTF